MAIGANWESPAGRDNRRWGNRRISGSRRRSPLRAGRGLGQGLVQSRLGAYFAFAPLRVGGQAGALGFVFNRLWHGTGRCRCWGNRGLTKTLGDEDAVTEVTSTERQGRSVDVPPTSTSRVERNWGFSGVRQESVQYLSCIVPRRQPISLYRKVARRCERTHRPLWRFDRF